MRRVRAHMARVDPREACQMHTVLSNQFIMEPSHTAFAGNEGYKTGAPAVYLPPNVHYIGALDGIM